MRLFEHTIRGGNGYTSSKKTSSLTRRHKLAPVIEGLESRRVLSSASAQVAIHPGVVALGSVHGGTVILATHGMETGGTYSNQPSPA
jgi:hypothetical protein